jgi:hypothetical protein
MYNQDCLIPAAISSGLDNTGEERIHAAPTAPVTRPFAAPLTTFIVVWGEQEERMIDELTEFTTDGISLKVTEPFNSELPVDDVEDTITLLGYYAPDYEYDYPPLEDPLPVNLLSSSFVELGLPFVFDSDRWVIPLTGTAELTEFAGRYLVVQLQVNDDEPILGVVFVKEIAG